MKTKTYKSTELIHKAVMTTTNDPRMIEILKHYIKSSYHQGRHYNEIIHFGIDHYEGVSYDAKYPCTHLKIYFGPIEYTIMSLKKLKRWGRRKSYLVEDLFQNSYDHVGRRIETIMNKYSSEPLTTETVRKICDEVAEMQHKIDLQRAWELFQKHATYIHPRIGRETCKMTLHQFVTQMEGCIH